MICTTLNAIRAHNPCEDFWDELISELGKVEADSDPLPFSKIVEINGIEGALWATIAAPEYDREWRLFAVWCAREASKYSNDWRIVYSIQVAERYAHGTASKEQLEAARIGVQDAGALLDTLFDVKNPSWDTMWAARDAALVATGEEASAAAYASAICLSWAITRDTTRELLPWSAQTTKFLEIVN